MPVSHIIKGAKSTIQERVAAYELDHLSNCFDDLRSALEPANKYLTNEPEAPNDIVKFLKEATEVNRAVMKAISSLGSTDEKKLLKESMDAYDKALDGMPLIGKFFRTWKNIYKGKVCNFLIFFCQLRKKIRSEAELIRSFNNDDSDGS